MGKHWPILVHLLAANAGLFPTVHLLVLVPVENWPFAVPHGGKQVRSVHEQYFLTKSFANGSSTDYIVPESFVFKLLLSLR